MTRTERNTSPAAIMRDRHSRTGLNKTEQSRKNGAGAHNWGSFSEEEKNEYEGSLDARLETAMYQGDDADDVDNSSVVNNEEEADGDEKVHDPTETDLDERNPINELDSRGVAQPIPGGRRMSNVSEEERERALRYREGGLKQNGVDLASIARTSYGVAQSPPANSTLGTSPLRTKAGFSMQQ